MDIRMRRLASDYEQVMKDFANHKNIVVTPIGDIPPEKYHITYNVPGLYLQPDGTIQILHKHEVEIILHADYPRYKPICKILTPIWHPNFRDGQICIGDIWGAGESLSDIIVNIGDMIQYRSWNSSSPLSADAAAWAMENRHLFPLGDVELNIPHKKVQTVSAEIELLDGEDKGKASSDQTAPSAAAEAAQLSTPEVPEVPAEPENDFEITAEELEGIEYVPTAQRMQGGSANAGKTVKVKINFRTVLVKGILWALIGAIIGFGFGELSNVVFPNSTIASMLGYRTVSRYFKYKDRADALSPTIYRKFEAYCDANGLDMNATESISEWIEKSDEETKQEFADYTEANSKAEEQLEDAYKNDFASDSRDLSAALARVTRFNTAIWSGTIALFIGLFLGLGEGIYYGSKKNALRYALIGAAISFAIGSVSGYIAQWMYASMIEDDAAAVVAALVRGLGWAIMGLGIGIAVGLIKPEPKRIAFCAAGGLIGAFLGGFLFNYVGDIVPNAVASRAVALIIMGILIGVGVGLLEQFAKSAWLKVIRGEFEGKEYLIFPGVTSIGNDSQNTIVLFKDKLIAQHQCDIVMQGSKYVLQDCGTAMGTVVNGTKIKQRILQQGDAIAIGNSILVFNSK